MPTEKNDVISKTATDFIMASLNSLTTKVDEINDRVSKIDIIEHKLDTGEKRFDKMQEQIDRIEIQCHKEGCMSPNVSTTLAHLSRHIGDIDSFIEKTNKQVEGERMIDVLEDVAKAHKKKEKLQDDIKSEGIKRAFFFIASGIGGLILIGAAVGIFMMMNKMTQGMMDIMPLIEKLQQTAP